MYMGRDWRRYNDDDVATDVEDPLYVDVAVRWDADDTVIK